MSQIAEMNKTSQIKTTGETTCTDDHLKILNVTNIKERDTKRTQKERILEQIYRVQKPQGRPNAPGLSARQALKANLRQNMKKSVPRTNEGL